MKLGNLQLCDDKNKSVLKPSGSKNKNHLFFSCLLPALNFKNADIFPIAQGFSVKTGVQGKQYIPDNILEAFKAKISMQVGDIFVSGNSSKTNPQSRTDELKTVKKTGNVQTIQQQKQNKDKTIGLSSMQENKTQQSKGSNTESKSNTYSENGIYGKSNMYGENGIYGKSNMCVESSKNNMFDIQEPASKGKDDGLLTGNGKNMEGPQDNIIPDFPGIPEGLKRILNNAESNAFDGLKKLNEAGLAPEARSNKVLSNEILNDEALSNEAIKSEALNDEAIKNNSRAQYLKKSGEDIDPDNMNDSFNIIKGLLNSQKFLNQNRAAYNFKVSIADKSFGLKVHFNVLKDIQSKNKQGPDIKTEGFVENFNNGIFSNNSLIADKVAYLENISSLMFDSISLYKAKGTNEMEISLEPEYLGKLKIKVTSKNEKIDIAIRASVIHTNELLQDSVQELKDSLAAKGLIVNQVVIDVEEQSSKQKDGFSNLHDGNKKGGSIKNIISADLNENLIGPILDIANIGSSNSYYLNKLI